MRKVYPKLAFEFPAKPYNNLVAWINSRSYDDHHKDDGTIWSLTLTHTDNEHFVSLTGAVVSFDGAQVRLHELK